MHVKIRTRTVGQYFGTVGQVVARNGRVLHETQVRPYKFTQAAQADAETWARAHLCEAAPSSARR